MLSQDIVTAEVGAGDSGSPVFTTPNEFGQVVLVGILWGGSTNDISFVYSAIANVEGELGALITSP